MDSSTLNYEDYVATLRAVMANAIKTAETLQAEAEADREAAFSDMDKRQDLLRKLENEAQRKAEDEMPQLHRQMKQEMINALTLKLQNKGMAAADIETLLKDIGA